MKGSPKRSMSFKKMNNSPKKPIEKQNNLGLVVEEEISEENSISSLDSDFDK